MDADVKKIYENLYMRYPITLSSSLSMGFKSKTDFPVLHGYSALGYFKCFFDGVSFPFYVMRDNKEVFAHWHAQTPEEAEEIIADFMDGSMVFGHPNNT